MPSLGMVRARLRRHRVPLLLAVLGLLLYLSSLLAPLLRGRAEAGERLPELVAKAVALVNATDRLTSMLVIGANATAPIPAGEAEKLASQLYRKASELRASGGDLGTRLAEALESYAALAGSTAPILASPESLARGFSAARNAASLLARCRVREAVQAYQADRSRVEEARRALEDAALEASNAKLSKLLSPSHRSLAEDYTGKLYSLAKALDALEKLIGVAEKNPDLVEAAVCRHDPRAAGRLAGLLGYKSTADMASALTPLSPELAAELLSAAQGAGGGPGHAGAGSSGHGRGNGRGTGRGAGQGAGYSEPESDD